MSVELPDVHRQFYLYYEGIIALHENESTEKYGRFFRSILLYKKKLKGQKVYVGIRK